MKAKEWSIVLPALNEEEHIGSCLAALCELDYDRKALEVVVVDNGSTDHTILIAKSFAAQLDLQVLQVPKVTVAALRNIGAGASNGRFLAFLDSDCIVDRSWLSRARLLLQEHPKAVIGAFYGISKCAGWPARLWYQYFNQGRRGGVSYLPASNLLMARSLFLNIGGFNADLASNEDSQICAKARSAGCTVLAVPELAITHLGAERSLVDFAKRQFWHGSSVLNRIALKSNIRAIGIAAYTLCCVAWTIGAGLSGHGPSTPLLLAVLPPATLTFWAAWRRRRGKDVPLLFTLVLTYAFARALALPIALTNQLRSGFERKAELKGSTAHFDNGELQLVKPSATAQPETLQCGSKFD